MNLFKNRPLAFICAVIIFALFVAHRVPAAVKLIMIAAALILFIVALSVAIKSARRRVAATFICLCAIGAALASSVALFTVDVRAQRARAFEGAGECELLIISERESEKSDTYDAMLRDIDGNRVRFDASLCLFFEGELHGGDLVRVSGDVLEAGALGGYSSEGAELEVFVYDSGDCVLISEDNFSLRVLFASMRERTSKYLRASFGEESGALAGGILLGDTDGISRDLVRDFRRSGTSHLLAVSGLHISMLVAMAELILSVFCVGKRARCVVLSILSLIFLGMTGFAMSACRSVFMLLFVYLNYLFVRESDSLTALFGSVAVIMLISPAAVTDVGLWLSFLATLGIIAVYSPIVRYFKRPCRRGFWAGALRLLTNVAAAVFLSFVCNVFTAMVVWLVFGEISAVTLISNLILTPISLVFLVAVPIGMLFASLGALGDLIVGGIRGISELIEYLCGVFSDIDGALISLEYGFAGVIIIAMSVAIAVMLVINMRHKGFILIPPAAAVAAFLICLSIHNAINAGAISLAYRVQSSNEMLVMSERHSASVIDISSGAYSFLNLSRTVAKESYATEIDDILLTHYHEAHPVSLELMSERVMVRRICIPTPVGAAEQRIAREILEVAASHGCEVLIYESGETLTLLSEVRVRIDRILGEADTVALFIANDDEALAYIGDGVRESEGALRYCSLADHVIFGAHGGSEEHSESRNFILH